jgi:hypothetical protein
LSARRVHRLARSQVGVRPVLNFAQEGAVAPGIVSFGHDRILAPIRRHQQGLARAKYFGEFTDAYRADAINHRVAIRSHFIAYMHNMRKIFTIDTV